MFPAFRYHLDQFTIGDIERVFYREDHAEIHDRWRDFLYDYFVDAKAAPDFLEQLRRLKKTENRQEGPMGSVDASVAQAAQSIFEQYAPDWAKISGLLHDLYATTPHPLLASIIVANELGGVRDQNQLETRKIPQGIAELIFSTASSNYDGFEGFTVLPFFAACLYAQKSWPFANDEQAFACHKQVLTKDRRYITDPDVKFMRVCSVRSLIVRYFLGLGVQRDVEQASKLLTDHKDDRCGCDGYYRPLEDMIQSGSDPRAMEAEIILVHWLYNHDAPTDAFHAVLEQGQINPSARLLRVLYAMLVLARSENWGGAKPWHEIFKSAHAAYMSTDHSEDDGMPWRYGPLDSALREDGMPIVGSSCCEFYGGIWSEKAGC